MHLWMHSYWDQQFSEELGFWLALMFLEKAISKFLGFVGIIPIYRLLEGAEHLSKNDITFDRCSKMLSENKSIIIYSEGLCIQERRLRKLKKELQELHFMLRKKQILN